METIALDGKATSKNLNDTLKEKVAISQETYGRAPGLVTILVGDDPASKVYVDMKSKTCQEIGMKSVKVELPSDSSIEEIRSQIRSFNTDPEIDGILVQMPLPTELRQYEPEVMNLIAVDKDVDGFNPHNIGLNNLGDETYASCTPKGMIRILEENGIPIEGQEVVIVNRTNVIGKPLALMFIKRSATVTICHSKTQNLDFHLQRADIIAVGVGHINFITADRIKEGVTILDAGINRNEEGKLCGDVDYAGVQGTARAVTPVPGGLGPMTIAMLMENTYLAYLKHNESNI